MKILFCTISTLVLATSIKAQSQKDEFKLMIDSAISISYRKNEELNREINISAHSQIFYLLDERNRPLDYLPSSREFKFIDIYNHRNRKLISKGIYAWKVFPTLNKNQFVVTVVDFYITYKNHNYNFANGGGTKTIFEYDCERKMWVMIMSESNGN
jgi:hypothetical protein